MFSLICIWINGCVNTREAGDLRCHHAHNDVTLMHLYNRNPYACKRPLYWHGDQSCVICGPCQWSHTQFAVHCLCCGLANITHILQRYFTHGATSYDCNSTGGTAQRNMGKYIMGHSMHNKTKHNKPIGTFYRPTFMYRIGTSVMFQYIKMWYYQYGTSQCGDKTVTRLSYLHIGISNMSKTSLWIYIESRPWQITV